MSEPMFTPEFVKALRESGERSLKTGDRNAVQREGVKLVDVLEKHSQEGLKSFIQGAVSGEFNFSLIGKQIPEIKEILDLSNDDPNGSRTRRVVRICMDEACHRRLLVFRFERLNSFFGIMFLGDLPETDREGILALFGSIREMCYAFGERSKGDWGRKLSGNAFPNSTERSSDEIGADRSTGEDVSSSEDTS